MANLPIDSAPSADVVADVDSQVKDKQSNETMSCGSGKAGDVSPSQAGYSSGNSDLCGADLDWGLKWGDRLGFGGYSQVYKCENQIDGKEYALKAIPFNREHEENFVREVRVHAQFEHPNIVRYYQTWIERGCFTDVDSGGESLSPNDKKDSRLCILMELYPRTLSKLLEPESSEVIDSGAAWNMFLQIVLGLQHIHSKGIIHTDLCPANLFLDKDNNIKIGDFGCAILKFNGDANRLGSERLTTVYSSPETNQENPVLDEKVDVYSLGIILVELLHPFQSNMERAHVLSDLKDRKLPSTWKNGGCNNFLWELLSQNPADRPSTQDILQRPLPWTVGQRDVDTLKELVHSLQQELEQKDQLIQELEETRNILLEMISYEINPPNLELESEQQASS